MNISEGDYIAISGGRITVVSDTPENAVLSMLEASDIDLCEIITLFVGANVSAEKRAELTESLKEIYDEYEITVYEGGQDVYDYLVAVE
jgi:dihydroxyacetone kinase-like predicted kinase